MIIIKRYSGCRLGRREINIMQGNAQFKNADGCTWMSSGTNKPTGE